MPVIPWPVHYQSTDGQFYVPDDPVISYSGAGIARTAQLLQLHLEQRLRLSPVVAPAEELGQSVSISLVCESEKISTLAPLPNDQEAYELNVSESSILIRAHAAHGVFHGVQTLIQLLPPNHSDGGISLDCVQVSCSSCQLASKYAGGCTGCRTVVHSFLAVQSNRVDSTEKPICFTVEPPRFQALTRSVCDHGLALLHSSTTRLHV